MKAIETALGGVLIIEPKVFADERGHFSEVFNEAVFSDAVGESIRFVQDNQSLSSRGVLRGLHFQLPPHGQGKLVRVSVGRILDVAVDIRPGSPTLGQWIAQELSSENHRQLWIPAGFAHGFLVLSDTALVQYKVTGYYAPGSDRSLRWDDPAVGIDWPDVGQPPIISAKDAAGKTLEIVLAEIRATRVSP